MRGYYPFWLSIIPLARLVLLPNGVSLVTKFPISRIGRFSRAYRAHAATARELANAATDPGAQKDYLNIARYWLDRALDYESVEWFGSKP
jgi:hypothetical protein